jgi:hypothetical protein
MRITKKVLPGNSGPGLNGTGRLFHISHYFNGLPINWAKRMYLVLPGRPCVGHSPTLVRSGHWHSYRHEY